MAIGMLSPAVVPLPCAWVVPGLSLYLSLSPSMMRKYGGDARIIRSVVHNADEKPPRPVFCGSKHTVTPRYWYLV